MCWSLQHADSAADIAKSLVESLCEEDVGLETRSVRLMLVSDVVHNAGSTSAPSAWCFRREFEAVLPEAFEFLHHMYKGEDDETLRQKVAERVTRVLASWRSKGSFAAQYVRGLEVSFFRDMISANTLTPTSGRLPEGLLVKIAEWRGRHFSELEKLARSR
eukprot:2596829-Amphidinium_carterae.1